VSYVIIQVQTIGLTLAIYPTNIFIFADEEKVIFWT